MDDSDCGHVDLSENWRQQQSDARRGRDDDDAITFFAFSIHRQITSNLANSIEILIRYS